MMVLTLVKPQLRIMLDWPTTIWRQGFMDLSRILIYYKRPSINYSLSAFKWHKSNIKNLLMKSSEIVFIFLPAFYLIIWLMTSSKNSEKISILKVWQLVFFWNVKIYFGKFLLKWCIFRHGKIWFSQIMPFNSYHFCLM